MAICEFKTSKGNPCGKLVSREGDLCKNHKGVAKGQRAEAAKQERLRKDPEKMKEFKWTRLENQRRRGGVLPENHMKELPKPFPRKTKQSAQETKEKKRPKSPAKHNKFLRSRKAAEGDGLAEEDEETTNDKWRGKIRRRLRKEEKQQEGDRSPGPSGDAREKKQDDDDDDDDNDGEDTTEMGNITDSDSEDEESDSEANLQEAVAFEKSTHKEREWAEEEVDEAVTVEEEPELQIPVPKPFGIRFYEHYSQPLSPSRVEDMTSLVNERGSDVKAKLGVVYFKNQERHRDETDLIWECPERTATIIKTLKKEGILKVATELNKERRATKEDVMRVHGEDLWKEVEEKVNGFVEKMKNKKERLEYNRELYDEETLYVNKWTIDAALLGAGAVLVAVDHMLEFAMVIFSDDRPPGCKRVHFTKMSVVICVLCTD